MKLFIIAATIVLSMPIPALAGGKLGSVFNSEMVGANILYLEKYTGPARNTYESDNKINNTYKVDNCEIDVVISNKTVNSISLSKLSNKCTFDLNKFIPNISRRKPLLAHNVTFGLIDDYFGDGKYSATCL